MNVISTRRTSVRRQFALSNATRHAVRGGVEPLEPRTLLCAEHLDGTARATVPGHGPDLAQLAADADIAPERVGTADVSVGYDRATGQYVMEDFANLAHDDVLRASLNAAGYGGMGELLADLGSPAEFEGVADPPAGTAAPESVFGTDSRAQVTAGGAANFPYRSIGNLEGTGCSGAMISPYHFLTAAHCVHPGTSGSSFYGDLDVTLARTGVWERPYGEAEWTFVRTFGNWTSGGGASQDWALITLDRNVGNFTGWMGWEVRSDDNYFNGTTVNTAGYPGDKPEGTMWYTSGPIADGDASFLYYNGTMDTAPGQSGSPVWRYDSAANARYIVGVHAYGDGGNGFNEAVRQTAAKRDWDTAAITADNGVRAPTDRADLVPYDEWWNTSFESFSPDPVYVGGPLNLRGLVQNNGTAASGAYTVRFYLSTDTLINAADTLVSTTSMASLGAFDWTNAYATNARVPVNMAPGSYYVGYLIDSPGVVTEYLEGNNDALMPGTIAVSAIAPDSYEVDNTPADATFFGELTGFTVSNRTIHATGNDDWYELTPEHAGTLTVSLDFLHANGDVDLRLYAANGTTILASSTSTTNAESVSYAVTAGDTYFVRVYGYSGAVTPDYSITFAGPPDNVAPYVVTDTDQFQTYAGVSLLMNENLSGITAADVVVRNTTSGVTLPAGTFTVTTSTPLFGDTTVNVQLLGVPADGNYTVRLLASGVTDDNGNALDGNGNGVGGDDYLAAFRHLGGDANRDGQVNFADLSALAVNYGQVNRNWSQGNFNYSGDGLVGFGDLSILALNYGTGLARGVSALPPMPSATRDRLFADARRIDLFDARVDRNVDAVVR